jgi:hypothetical protein
MDEIEQSIATFYKISHLASRLFTIIGDFGVRGGHFFAGHANAAFWGYSDRGAAFGGGFGARNETK